MVSAPLMDDGLTHAQIARQAVEDDPVRSWIESDKHQEALRLFRCIVLAPSLEICVALLNGEHVPLDRLAPGEARRFGLKPHGGAAA